MYGLPLPSEHLIQSLSRVLGAALEDPALLMACVRNAEGTTGGERNVSTGQLWIAKDKRRPGHHRVLWVSPCGGYARVIRAGSHPYRARYVRTAYFLRRYRHHG